MWEGDRQRMNQYGYVLKKKEEKREAGRYHKSDLLLMTTYQLKEICRVEKLIQGVVNPMDKEELIRVILRYRGADEYYLIRSWDEKGLEALGNIMERCRIEERPYTGQSGSRESNERVYSSKIVAYEGLAIGFYDCLTIPYDKNLAGTNALVVGGDGRICAILNVEAKGAATDCLYLTKAAELSCHESEVKNYRLYLMNRKSSEILYRIYNGNYGYVPEHLEVYCVPLLDFEVRRPVALTMPLAMDFGTTNTTAGVYLDHQYFEKAGFYDGEYGLAENAVNYALFYDTTLDWEETTLFPSVVSVLSAEAGRPHFLFGYEAIRLADSSYIDEGFCIFYDIKRWIGDYERQEEITDSQGRRSFVQRKDILKAYFTHVIDEARNRFKCEVHEVHISCPVKQKAQFASLFAEILPEYAIEQRDMLDEGVSVLYSTISDMIQSGRVQEGKEYSALIIDCGGGTTDLCSCRFRIWDRRVSYRIEIDTAYENGDTDFGGNNLTYRIMQLLKIALVNRITGQGNATEQEILAGLDMDVYRCVDEIGAAKLYERLEEVYAEAEKYLPTRFREYEHRSREDYYKVKNNFYFLFQLAERMKKEFYNRTGTLRITLSAVPVEEEAVTWIPADRFKLSVDRGHGLEIMKEFPKITFSIYEMELLLTADIYGIIRRFMEELYENGKVEEYSIIKLTGQSCKIDLFRSALKEFVPGRTIQFKRRSGDRTKDYGLKMTCVDGALQYLRDKKYGFADVSIRTGEPALPYNITAYTHSGEEVILINGLKRNNKCGMISRNMENLVLKLYLKDLDGKERYQYTFNSSLADFREVKYEEIAKQYAEHIRQADTDDIVDREVKFFVWASPMDWAFCAVPVYRKDERLFLGKEEEFSFENDGWVRNFFDGMK